LLKIKATIQIHVELNLLRNIRTDTIVTGSEWEVYQPPHQKVAGARKSINTGTHVFMYYEWDVESNTGKCNVKQYIKSCLIMLQMVI
jgi:hypothetical protein